MYILLDVFSIETLMIRSVIKDLLSIPALVYEDQQECTYDLISKNIKMHE